MDTISVPSLTDELAEMDPFVIVEPGGTHSGKYDQCIRHIELTGASPAHAIKMQWLSSPLALAQRRNAKEYIDAYQNIAFPAEWHKDFAALAHKHQLQYGCSVYLANDVEVIGSYVDFFKVSSFEANDLAMLRLMSIYEKPIYISCGMRSNYEARRIIKQTLSADLGAPVYFLYCTTGYPVPYAQLNLSVLTSQIYHGFSDHSADVTVGARAYAAGARIFEVHTRIEATPKSNPDYAVALTYSQLKDYIDGIYLQQEYFGSPERKVQLVEEGFIRYKS